MKEEEK
jgi:hypothetical protein